MFSNPTDAQITELLSRCKRIAVVGLSPKSDRPSYRVASYLIEKEYEIIPVNPGFPEILGVKSYPDLKSIPGEIDIVDVFRNPDTVMPIVDEAIEIRVPAIWFQEGVINESAAQKAIDSGLQVIMDRCILKEHNRLLY
ncbi:MAG: CoA-binding protein [candidate division Zixibacteria bacterium CG_4_9_14_3_um_filter_46_8]|nr:MAG: CoA-binding protein [candidate division Zixibacteria bacterium CG_4_9_14_3_um_filter_46_8]